MKTHGWVTITEIEGAVPAHEACLRSEMVKRRGALDGVRDAAGLARRIGGEVEDVNLGGWVIGKDALPGVRIHFVYRHSQGDMPCDMEVLFSGDWELKQIPAGDLLNLAIAYANRMVRHATDYRTRGNLPQVCRPFVTSPREYTERAAEHFEKVQGWAQIGRRIPGDQLTEDSGALLRAVEGFLRRCRGGGDDMAG